MRGFGFRTFTTLALLLMGICVGGSMFGVHLLLEESKRSLQNARLPEPLPVVVALHELAAGTPIRAADVSVEWLHSDTFPADGTFRSVEELAGRTTGERILAEEVIRVERLEPLSP